MLPQDYIYVGFIGLLLYFFCDIFGEKFTRFTDKIFMPFIKKIFNGKNKK
jgi:hypothetical protein